METLINKLGKNMKESILKPCALIFLFIISYINAIAEETAQQTKEEIERHEFMSYVYMAIGLVIVIAVAWYTTVKGKKNEPESHGPKITPHHPISHKHDSYFGRHRTKFSRK